MKKLPWRMIFGMFFANWLFIPILKNAIDDSIAPDFYKSFSVGLISAIILVMIYSIKNAYEK